MNLNRNITTSVIWTKERNHLFTQSDIWKRFSFWSAFHISVQRVTSCHKTKENNYKLDIYDMICKKINSTTIHLKKNLVWKVNQKLLNYCGERWKLQIRNKLKIKLTNFFLGKNKSHIIYYIDPCCILWKWRNYFILYFDVLLHFEITTFHILLAKNHI